MEEDDGLLELRLRVRNQRIVSAASEKNVTLGVLAKDVRIPYNRFSAIVNLRIMPTEEDQIRIALYLEKPIDELFPESLTYAIDRFKDRKRIITETQVLSLQSPTRLLLTDGSDMEHQADISLLREAILKQLANLTPVEEDVLKVRFGFDSDENRSKTLEETAQIVCKMHPEYFKHGVVNRERIRQIEGKALRKLRHPHMSKFLKDFVG